MLEDDENAGSEAVVIVVIVLLILFAAVAISGGVYWYKRLRNAQGNKVTVLSTNSTSSAPLGNAKSLPNMDTDDDPQAKNVHLQMTKLNVPHEFKETERDLVRQSQ